MISVELDPAHEEQLRRLAAWRQQDVETVVRQLFEGFLDTQAWSEESDEDLTEALLPMLAEVTPPESWDEDLDTPGASA
ncbi:MAG TPA: hypothetical protein VML55_26060 [Planctomycetaceae bacterium]|nr:hypothetical protein [Planctomycetaceae bacterium]